MSIFFYGFPEPAIRYGSKEVLCLFFVHSRILGLAAQQCLHMEANNDRMDSEKKKVIYESPEALVYTFVVESGVLNNTSPGTEMGNGGFLDE